MYLMENAVERQAQLWGTVAYLDQPRIAAPIAAPSNNVGHQDAGRSIPCSERQQYSVIAPIEERETTSFLWLCKIQH